MTHVDIDMLKVLFLDLYLTKVICLFLLDEHCAIYKLNMLERRCWLVFLKGLDAYNILLQRVRRIHFYLNGVSINVISWGKLRRQFKLSLTTY